MAFATPSSETFPDFAYVNPAERSFASEFSLAFRSGLISVRTTTPEAPNPKQINLPPNPKP